MFENSIYSVISPEGCATILWRDPKKTLEAAEAMKLSSKDLFELGVIDEIIPEPLGGAHRDRDLCVANIRNALKKNLNELSNMTGEEIFVHRKNKFLSIGRKKGFIIKNNEEENLIMKETFSYKIYSNFKKFKNYLIFLSIFLILCIITFFL